jgi:hypothetical protein
MAGRPGGKRSLPPLDAYVMRLSDVINMNHISKAVENAIVQMSDSIEFNYVTLSSFL